MYALGIDKIDSVLMILAASMDITTKNNGNKQYSNIVTREFIRGFNDCCILGGTQLTGGQSVLNPWPMIGGTAKAVCDKNSFIEPYFGVIGDCIILTKPLGTQIAVNLQEWRLKNDRKYANLRRILINNSKNSKNSRNNSKNSDNLDSITDIAYNIAQGSMLRLNRNAAKLMQKYKNYCHGATDITGFGIKGHINNLAKHQRSLNNNNNNNNNGYEYYIDTLPVIKGISMINNRLKEVGMIDFKLLDGYSAETSGGLAIMMSKDKANEFIRDLWQLDGWPAFIIGEIREKPRNSGGSNGSNSSDSGDLCRIASGNDLNIIEVGYDTLPLNLTTNRSSKL